MGKYNLSFKLEPEDVERGYLTRKRYWELVNAGVASRGHELTSFLAVEGLGYLITTDDGWIIHHGFVAERFKLPAKIIKKYKSGEVKYGY